MSHPKPDENDWVYPPSNDPPRCARLPVTRAGWVTSPEAAGCKKHMPDPRTPGQVAYDAWWWEGHLLWECTGERERLRWESIAAAVMAHGRAK